MSLNYTNVITQLKAKFELKGNKVQTISDTSSSGDSDNYASLAAIKSYIANKISGKQDKDTLDEDVEALGYIKEWTEQVQVDWEEDDSTSVSYIKHKPTALADFAADATHRVVTDAQITGWNEKAEISDIPTKLSDLTEDSTSKHISASDKTAYDGAVTLAGTAVQPSDIANMVEEGDDISVLTNDAGYVDETALEDGLDSKTITVDVETPTSGDYAKIYTLKQGGVAISPAINIPKDMVVSSGSIVTKEGIKYLELVLNSGATVDIPVGDLCDVYTADNVTLVENNHQFSIKESYMQNVIDGLATAIQNI